jgi:hypothetical protein
MEGEARRQPVMLQNLPVGAKVRLRKNVLAEVTGNPKDGSWIFVKYLTHPEDPAQEGTEGLAFADEVLEEVQPA